MFLFTNTFYLFTASADLCSGRFVIAIGSERGDISLYDIDTQPSEGITSQLLYSLSEVYCHGSTVKRLKFKQRKDSFHGSDSVMLASCGEDCTVRVHKLRLQS